MNGSIGLVTAFTTVRQANEARILIAKVEPSGRGELTRDLPRTLGPDASTEWPVVKFENGLECLCPPMNFSVVNVFGETEASRDQVCVPVIPLLNIDNLGRCARCL